MRQKCAMIITSKELKNKTMKKGKSTFESGHPDERTRSTSGFQVSKIGALDAAPIENHQSDGFGFSREKLNQTDEKMINKIQVKSFNQDLTKRWYVEYYEKDFEANRWLRRREYGGVNKFKTVSERLNALAELHADIMSGFAKKIGHYSKDNREIKAYIDRYISDKKNTLRGTSIKNIKLALRYFWEFLQNSELEMFPIHQIKRKHIHDFRVYLSQHTGNRSVNGHLSFVKSFFNYYKNEFDDILLKNPCDGLKKLPVTTETHVAYTNDQMASLFAEMEEKYPMLLLYCKFIGYGFIRCEETRNLQVGDIDFERRTITLSAGYAKTRKRTPKPMLSIFYDSLMRDKIYNYPASFYIFSLEGRPGEKQVGKNYFRKQFKQLKQKHGLGKHYTIYGFRHTIVSQLLDRGAKWDEVMKYTGHTTMEAFARYARSLLIKPAQDLSNLLK